MQKIGKANHKLGSKNCRFASDQNDNFDFGETISLLAKRQFLLPSLWLALPIFCIFVSAFYFFSLACFQLPEILYIVTEFLFLFISIHASSADEVWY